MYVLKIDFPSGVAYFTGKKRIVQGTESPGLTDLLAEARLFETQEEAMKFCKMLIKRYDMEFYCTDMDGDDVIATGDDEEFLVDISDDISEEIAKTWDDAEQ